MAAMNSLFSPKTTPPTPGTAPTAPPADDGIVAQLVANPLFTGVRPPPTLPLPADTHRESA